MLKINIHVNKKINQILWYNIKINYYNLGGSYTKSAQRFTLNYGRQRGGLICIGGVCRFVPESTGLTANIVLSF